MKQQHRAVIASENLDTFESGDGCVLPFDVLHRFLKVLRLREGDKVELLDGSGRAVVGRLHQSLDGWFLVERQFHAQRQACPPMVLAQAMIRLSKLEPLVQKATEMGMTRLLLWQADRSESKIHPSKFSKKCDRLRKIALEATRQSGRFEAPEIEGLFSLSDLKTQFQAPATHFFAGEPRAEKWISDAFQGITSPPGDAYGIVVGPEGGLTPSELAFFQTMGVEPVRLSPHILRAETAAFPFLCALQWHRGRL